jgi:hypothetical protein
VFLSVLVPSKFQISSQYQAKNKGRTNLKHQGELVTLCNESKLMHYLSSVYSVTITVHVSGLLVAHRQEVTMYTIEPLLSGLRLTVSLTGMQFLSTFSARAEL